MLYAILCYHDEDFVGSWSKDQDAAVMKKLAVVQDKPWKGIPNGIVYQKGGWTLHMLRGQIGTEKFWAGIREYYHRYRDSNASSAGPPAAHVKKTVNVL